MFDSRYFRLHEFLRSDAAVRHGINMQPPTAVVNSLRDLCYNVLDPLREHLGRPITITSGWRPHELNQLIGGATNSQHVRGEAADIEVEGLRPVEVCQAIEALKLPFDQLILEYPPHGWCHVSYGPRHRGEILTIAKGQATRVGLHAT